MRFAVVVTAAVAIACVSVPEGVAQIRDQGPVHRSHVQDALEFKREYFYRDDVCCDVAKVLAFRQRLDEEHEKLQRSLYETLILDHLELDVVPLEEAKETAMRELLDERNSLASAYSKYLIPQVEKLQTVLARTPFNREQAEALIDSLVRVYSLFYVPNTARNLWGKDTDHPSYVRNIRGYKFKRERTEDVEANNLVVPSPQRAAVQRCLGAIPFYLSFEDVAKLKSCRFDVSRLEPGPNPFWTEVSRQGRKTLRHEDRAGLFPTSADKVSWEKILYSGNGEPRFSASFTRNGKKIGLKVRTGHEVHSQIAVGHLARMVGFNQDHLRYYPRIRVHLGTKTFDEFAVMFLRLYEEKHLPRFIEATGTEGEEEWLDITDVSVEVNDPDLLRLGSYDFEGWDLPNRREHRGELLFLAWLNIVDTKAANYKMLLAPTKDGLQPVYRMHDPGTSLDRSHAIRKFDDYMKLIIQDDRNVNQFPASFLSWSADDIHVWWSDLVFRNGRRFATTTYADLKWMARKISALADKDILFALKQSGMPDDVVDLYYHKLRLRRNEIVEAFGLTEFPLFEVPNLKTYSPNFNVQNGNVVKKFYDGHNEYQTRRTNAFTYLLENISGSLSLFGLSEDFEFDIKESFETETSISPVHIADSALLPGVKLILGRTVRPNPMRWNSPEGGHGFVVQDTLGIELGLGCDFTERLKDFFPITLEGHLNVYSSKIQFIHYADSHREAYFSRFRLFEMIRNLNHAIAHTLRAGEVITVHQAYGIDFAAEAGIHIPGTDVFETAAGLELQWIKDSPTHFLRDHFGTLHILKEKSQIMGAGLHVNLLQLNLKFASFGLIGLDLSYNRFFTEGQLFSFDLGEENRNLAALTPARRDQEFSTLAKFHAAKETEALQKFLSGEQNQLDSVMHRKFKLNAEGYTQSQYYRFLGFGSAIKDNGYTQVNFAMPEQATRVFHRYYKTKRASRVFDRIPVVDNEDILVPAGETSSIEVELDDTMSEPDMSVNINVQNYLRRADRTKVVAFIANENRKFSRDGETPFYSNYTLPPKAEVNSYRKIYSDAHIRISSEGISKHLLAWSPQDVYTLAKPHFAGIFPWRAYRLRQRFATLLAARGDSKAFTQALGQFISGMMIPKFGVGLLRELVGSERLQVHGQIYGILRSFTQLQRTEAHAGLRFAANHWGTMKTLSPIRKFLKEVNPLPINMFVDLTFDINTLLGDLPTAAPTTH